MQNVRIHSMYLLGLIGLQALACRQVYVPPEVVGNPGLLVVDGFLHAGSDTSIISLSRTSSLNDTSRHPEIHAQVYVTGSNGNQMQFREIRDGVYASDNLHLDAGASYVLSIQTADRRTYASDSFPVMQSPPIDSLSWQQDSVGVSVYAYTHDPSNQTRNYRWDYVETWQYHAGLLSNLTLDSGYHVVNRPPDQQIYDCWASDNSSSLVLATSSNLTRDSINHQLVCQVETGSEKLSVMYSILVNQYALTPGAFDYWQNLHQMTELTGSLFDPAPSQVEGNLHCLSNPDEPVLGFIGASTVSSMRIFISALKLTNWNYYPYYIDCLQPSATTIGIGDLDPDRNAKLYDYVVQPDHLYVIVFAPPGGVILYYRYCADCTEHGGTNKKPAFWP